MARSRNIKPGFFKNEMLAECAPLARLLFAGLWCLADRAGRLEDRPKRIHAEVMPYDDGSVDAMLNELHQAGFIQRYQVDSQQFIQVLNFAKHQNPHYREAESTIPAPVEADTGTGNDNDEPRAGLGLSSDKHGTSLEQAMLIPDSLNLIPDARFLTQESSPCSPSASGQVADGFDDFWKLYPRKVAKPGAVKAWKKLKPTGDLQKAMIEAIQSKMSSADWQKNSGQFIPHPATWLNGRRWEDEQKVNGQQALPFGNLENQDYTKGITHDGRF